MSNEVCGDNRFEIIEKAKRDLLESTNISTSEDEMQVIDNFLFRCWQMGWLEKYEQPKEKWIPCEERLPSEENEEYLVCKKNGCLMLLVWTKKGWNTYKDYYGKYHTECEINDVIAWMPKPQPYKKEGGNIEM